ncbi:MAG: four helix bundle protein [Desulfobacteraceae bacterium]|nr:MAG: four helix bundle protein [Desulfobacteraceae bacterium]
MKITRFEEIEAWQEARKLVNKIYDAINKNRKFKMDFRLMNQMQGAAVSSMANISEGFARKSNKEFSQFLFIAKSSAAEVQSHLYVALDQGYINQEEFEEIYMQAEKVSKMISGFIKYLSSQINKPH